MAGKPPILSSRSFKGQKALVGKQFRTGALGRSLNDIYGDIDTAFAEIEAELTQLVWKNLVKVASTGNLTLSDPQTIDGVAVVAGDRVLVKNQTTGAENGIYVVAAGAWSRSADFDATAEVVNSAVIPVADGGTANGGTRWKLTNTNAITVGTTALTFGEYTELAKGATVALDEANGMAITQNDRRAGIISFTNDGDWSSGAAKTITVNSTLIKITDVVMATTDKTVSASAVHVANGSVRLRLVNLTGGTIVDNAVTLINWAAL